MNRLKHKAQTQLFFCIGSLNDKYTLCNDRESIYSSSSAVKENKGNTMKNTV